MPDKYNNRIKPKATQSRKKGQIFDGADNYKGQSEEDKKFTIGYEFYRNDLCEIDSTPHSPLRKSIHNFKKLCTCTNVYQIKQLGIHTNEVNNANTYSKFFQGLDEDVEMKEFYLGDSARGMFFIDPTKKVIQIIAHTNTHTPLGKQVK
jgi:hypothetical protein